MLGSIALGVAIVAIIVIIAYLATHHKAPSTPAGADLANAVGSAATDAWEAVKRDLPSIVSADLAQARADGAALLERAQTAEAKLAAALAAHDADLAAVAARITAAVRGDPLINAPAVAAAQAEDVAAVKAATVAVS